MQFWRMVDQKVVQEARFPALDVPARIRASVSSRILTLTAAPTLTEVTTGLKEFSPRTGCVPCTQIRPHLRASSRN
eukprot:8293858-Prorocentrum_lima.AAC.1